MPDHTTEMKIRARLPLIRFVQAYLPFQMANGLMKIGNRIVNLPEGVTRTSVSADGVAGEWLVPAGSPRDRALLYLHGGGFVYRLSMLHIEMVANLAKQMGIPALAVDYRVAPAHPYPAALDDCVTAFHWLVQQGIPAQNIVVAGDSAGGNLTITTMMKLRNNGEALPAAGACLSPVGNLTWDSEPAQPFHDPLLHPKAVKRYNRAYVGKLNPRNPLISPVFGDWRGLPPLLVHAGEEEILRDDAVEMVEKAQAAGVDARLKIFPRMWHVWQLYLDLPEARESLAEIAGFLGEHLKERV